MKDTSKNDNRFFKWEILRLTLFVFLVTWVLKLVFIDTHLFNNFSQSLRDFDFTDLVYLKDRDTAREPVPNHDIVMVNIGQTRAEIAAQITTLEKFGPRVLAVDAWFEDRKPEAKGEDSLLAAVLGAYDNIILAGYIRNTGQNSPAPIAYIRSLPEFTGRHRDGFANLVAEKANTVRYFSPSEVVNGDTLDAFAVEIARKISPASDSVLKERGNELEYIRYRHKPEDFLRFHVQEVRPDNPNLSQVAGKIVILAQLGKNLEMNLMEDANFTPFNVKMSGRSFPDMYGAYIHANIIAMLLNGDYTNKIGKWFTWFLSFLVCYLHLWYFTRFYLYRPGWFHVFTKFMQLFSGAVLVGISVVLLGVFNRKLDVDYLIVPVLLSVDCIYLYDFLVRWAAKRFSFRSAFLEAHH